MGSGRGVVKNCSKLAANPVTNYNSPTKAARRSTRIAIIYVEL